MPHTAADRHQDIRDAVRALCAGFPDAYHREIDAARGYPEAFVDALTKAGWLAALIPQEYGGSGLGLAIAKAIVEGHTGSISVTDRDDDNQGARFTIRLPAAER